jgi:hypothetical protein
VAERKLDIFEALAAVDRRDGKWFEKQSDEAKKEFSPPVFLRWISSISDANRAGDVLLAVNDIVNLNMWDIVGEYPDLIFKLATLCGVGRQRHEWIAMAGRRGGANKARDLIVKFNSSASDQEIDMLLRMHTKQSFIAFVDDTAVPPDEAKEILKAYDKFKSVKDTKIKETAKK